MRAQSPERVDALTGIRIVAAALVVLSHVSHPEFLPVPLRTFLAAGYNGVTLFFVLSGFVIAWNYADRLASPDGRALLSYSVARFARIYPLYLFSLVFAASATLLNFGWPPHLWLHVLSLQTWHPDRTVAFLFNNPGWSVGVELFLYACFPLLIVPLYRLRRSPRALIGVAVACVVLMASLALWFTITGRAGDSRAADSAHRWLYRMPLTRLGDFVVGIVTALLVRHHPVRRVQLPAAAQVVGAVSILGLMMVPSLLSSAWSFDVTTLVPASLLIWGLAAAPNTRLARGLSARSMVLAGEASYAVYLLHFPLLGMLDLGVADGMIGWLTTVALQGTIIMCVALGAHLMIERPAQLWLRNAVSIPKPSSERDAPRTSA